MTKIDSLIERMVSRDVQKVVLSGDLPMRLSNAGGETEGPIVSTADLDAMLVEAAPENLKRFVVMRGRSGFFHQSAHGAYQVSFVRNQSGVKVTVTAATENHFRVIGAMMAVGGVLCTVLFIVMAHVMVETSGKFFPVFVALGPAVVVMGLSTVVTGKLPSKDFTEMEPLDYAFFALALIAGFSAYGLFKSGVI